jgi:thiamine kinase-like enzyme
VTGMNTIDPRARAAALSCWSGAVTPEPLKGGITNANFVVTDRSRRHFVRIGDDIIVHGILRFHELAASRAAAEAGLSPAVLHHEPGAVVFEYVDGRTFTAADVCQSANLRRILPLLQRCHREMPRHFRGPALIFWVFQIFRDYAQTLADCNSRMVAELPRLLSIGADLEAMVGPIDVVFGHNDLLPGNFIDDGKRLWLIDWDYGGFNSPLFDLGNLCSNNDVAETDERWLLENYFERPLTPELWHRYQAMKCASLLREAMWSMVAEHHSTLDFDYVAYTDDYFARFERAYHSLKQL